MSIRRLISVTLLLLLISLMGIPLVSASQQPATQDRLPAQDDSEVIRVGTVPVMVFAPLFLAEFWGYYDAEGIEVEIMGNPGGAEPLAPLARGELEIVVGGIGAGQLNYAARNLEVDNDPGFRVVAGGHIERPPMTSPLVVSAQRYDSGEITSVADLAGGRVSINATGAATEYWIYKALEQGGLTLDDVELVAVAFPDVPAALNSEAEDRIDGAILGEPIVSAAEAQGLVRRLSVDFLEEFQPTFVYMANDFIAERPEDAEAFLRALVMAYRRLQDPEVWRDPEVLTFLSETVAGYSEDLLDYYAFPYYDPNGEVYVENLADLQEYFQERGVLAYEELIDVESLLDTSLLESVIEDIGIYEEDAE